MLKKVFNWSEVHLSEMTCYKTHTLAISEKVSENDDKPNQNLSFAKQIKTLNYKTKQLFN